MRYTASGLLRKMKSKGNEVSPTGSHAEGKDSGYSHLLL